MLVSGISLTPLPKPISLALLLPVSLTLARSQKLLPRFHFLDPEQLGKSLYSRPQRSAERIYEEPGYCTLADKVLEFDLI